MSIVNDKPTPKTDHLEDQLGSAAKFSHPIIWRHARDLERERDEAITRRMETIMQCELYEQERDEARELHRNALREREATEKEVDATLERAQKAERERDEAREALREIWQSGDAFLPRVDSETTNRWRKAAGWEET